jgi:hypothetical protein
MCFARTGQKSRGSTQLSVPAETGNGRFLYLVALEARRALSFLWLTGSGDSGNQLSYYR